MIRQAKEATIVVMMAPRIPRLKNSCSQSETPKIFFSSSSIEIVTMRATTNMQTVTQIWRPIKNDWKLFPENVKLQFALATGEASSSDGGIFTTANMAICIPSIIPTKAMRTKKTITETYEGTPSHIDVLSSNKAVSVTPKQKARTASDMNTRAQKKIF